MSDAERLTDERVREFAAWVLGQHTGTIEGCDIEEKAVALGLMEAVEVTEPCGAEGACECAMTDNLPGLCYRSRLAARAGDREGREGDTALRREIEHAINRFSAENGSDTPDFILAEYLMATLAAFDAATRQRSAWYRAAPGGERRTEG